MIFILLLVKVHFWLGVFLAYFFDKYISVNILVRNLVSQYLRYYTEVVIGFYYGLRV